MSTTGYAVLGIVVAIALAGSVAGAIVARRRRRQRAFEQKIKRFALQRERLEAKFVQLASATGKPKGLQWENIDFHSPVSFVRDRATGELSAFVEITIQFSAIEGGGMEEVPAVKDLRNATALFHCHQMDWGTGGKALFNMNPAEAIRHYQAQYEPVSSNA